MTSDNKYIIYTSTDLTLNIYNLDEKRSEPALKGHNEGIRALAITNDNKFVVSGGDKDLRIWDIQEERQVFTSTGHNNAILSLAVSSDNKVLVTGSGAIGNMIAK